MPRGINKKTKRLTVSAVSAALGVVILALGSFVEVLDLSSSAFAGMIVIFTVIEIGGFWPWAVFGATGLLALLLPMKLPAVFYLLFCGWYPIIKEKIERLHSRVLQWVIKLALLNAALTLVILAGRYILALPDTELSWSWVLYLMGNAAFVLFDIALTRLITLYIVRLRKRFRIDKM